MSNPNRLTIGEKYDLVCDLIRADPTLDQVAGFTPDIIAAVIIAKLDQELRRAGSVANVEAVLDRWLDEQYKTNYDIRAAAYLKMIQAPPDAQSISQPAI